MTRSKRPTKFKLGVFDWDIKYIDVEGDIHGDTDRDTRSIRIFTHGYSDQVVKDTLLHECLHVCLEDIVETTHKIDDKPDVVEEQIVRLLTPRVHELFMNNKDLREYIFNKPKPKKELDKSRKK